MNKYKKYICLLFIFILYFVIGKIFNFYLPCPIHKLTNLYCPGCGITRMFIALFHLDFYKAFRYNQLLFIMLPIFIFLFIDYLIKIKKNKEPIYIKIPFFVYVLVIIITILFGVLRNIIPLLAPIE